MSNDDGKKSQPCKGLAIPMMIRFILMFSNLLREKNIRTEKHREKNPPMKTSNNVSANLSSAPCKNAQLS